MNTEGGTYTLGELLIASRDGDWGSELPGLGLVPYRVIRGADFPAAQICNVEKVPLRFLPEQSAARRTLQPGDILLETAGGSKDRSTGRTLYVTERLLCSLGGAATCASFARFLRIDPRKADPRFVYWYLQYLHQSGEMWQHQVQHTGVARFQYTRFAETHKITVPSFSRQISISEVLGALDDKIVANDRIASTTRLLAQYEFESAIRSLEVFQCELSGISELLSRGVTPRYTDDPCQLLVLNQKCIREGRVSLIPARRTQNDMVPVQKILQPHDVLVNSTGTGTLGRVARWLDSCRATVDSHVTIVRIDPDKADPTCAGFALLAAQQLIESLGEGSTGQTELSRTRLGALILTLPKENAARRLRPALDALEARGKAALDESVVLAALRDTLLPALMSGAIRVREAERIVEDAT